MNATSFDYSANISIMFTEVPYLERPAAARKAGFDQVETWWPSARPVLTQAEEDGLVEALDRADVRLSGLNFYAGDMAAGDRGVACLPERRSDLVGNIAQVVRIAERTGCRYFNLLYGQHLARSTPQEQQDSAVSAYQLAAERIAAIGGTVLIEPLARGLNGDYPLTTGDDVVELLTGRLADRDNLRLLFDLFHLGSNGVDLPEAARRLGPWIGHVQVADSPGRGEPGSGELPIEPTLKVLADIGYRGTVAGEYKPTRPTAETLAWLPTPTREMTS